jgi:hypothetical protein
VSKNRNITYFGGDPAKNWEYRGKMRGQIWGDMAKHVCFVFHFAQQKEELSGRMNGNIISYNK